MLFFWKCHYLKCPDFFTVSHQRRNLHVPEKCRLTPKPNRTQHQVRSHTLTLQALANHFELSNTQVKTLEHLLTVLQTCIRDALNVWLSNYSPKMAFVSNFRKMAEIITQKSYVVLVSLSVQP